MSKKTLKYPLELSDTGTFVEDRTKFSQLRLLLETGKGSRLGDSDFGFNTNFLEQEVLDNDAGKHLALAVITKELGENLAAEVRSIEFAEKPDSRTTVIDILFTENSNPSQLFQLSWTIQK